MIGKQICGRSFGGCVRYIVSKEGASIIDASGVRMQSAEAITHDFNLQRSMNPELGKAVGHLVLSWSGEDLAKLNPQIMAERAREYLEKMNIRNTQYLVVSHSDRQHPHLHIIYNRVDNTGKTITDRNNYKLNIKVCKEMTLKYGYHLGKGKEQVNRPALKGKEKIRYELYDAIKSAARKSVSWKQLKAELEKQGIGIQYKLRSGSSEVQGISFEKGEFKMKGSAIDRAFSYSRLNAQLERNLDWQQRRTVQKGIQPEYRNTERTAQHQKQDQPQQHSNHSLLDTLLRPTMSSEDWSAITDGVKRRRKKRRIEESHSQGHSL